jgi:uncharacterized membrane protein
MSLEAPADGPAQVLSEVARRRGLRYSRAHVRAALERHPEPSSLLALVEVAPSLGLRATAGQGDMEALDVAEEEELPAILHFAGEEGGFGLLEAVLPEGRGFRIWDSRHGRRVVEREALSRAWSGIVVFLERAGPEIPERGYWRRRAREVLWEEWRPRTELAGPAASRTARLGLGVLAAALLGLAVLAQPPEWRLEAAALAGLTALGLAASLTALGWTRGKASALCGAGGPVDCESVLLSEQAYVAGVPLSGLGTAFFGASLLLQSTPGLGAGAAPLWLAGAAFLPALPLSVLLVGALVRMRRFCTLCLTVHGVNAAGAALFVLGIWPAVPFPPSGLVSAALLLALLFVLLLSTAVPYLSRAGEDAEVRREHARLLRTPPGTLARLALEPRLELEGERVGALVGEAEAPHALVVLAHPSCKPCGPALEELEALVEQHGAWLRGFVGVAPLDPEDPRDAVVCEALAAVGVAFGGAVLLQAFRVAKRDFARLYGDTAPRAWLARELGLDAARLDVARDEAWLRVRRAAALKARHAKGVPAFFLDGRRCEAPLSHVEAWCSRPALLDALLPRPEEAERAGQASAHEQREGAPEP